MLTTHRHGATTKPIELRTIITKATPDIANARDQLDAFYEIVRARKVEALQPWIEDARVGLLSSFASCLRADLAAVEAALRKNGPAVRSRVRSTS
jgi:hypothetical protein